MIIKIYQIAPHYEINLINQDLTPAQFFTAMTGYPNGNFNTLKIYHLMQVDV